MRHSELFGFLLFVSGYMIGRIDSILTFFKKKRSDSFVSKVCEEEKNVQDKSMTKKYLMIDDKKFVTKVSTDKFQKSGELGVTSEVDDDIQHETVKLLTLKKKKKV